MQPSYNLVYHTVSSPLDTLIAAADKDGLRALLIADTPAQAELDLQQRFPEAVLTAEPLALNDTLQAVLDWLDAPYHPLQLPLPINPCGSVFQQMVWQQLCLSRPGQRLSYSTLAAAIGKPSASRAVAGACAANPLAIVIPCHRILRSDGGIAGYRWGIARKRELLRREAAFAE